MKAILIALLVGIAIGMAVSYWLTHLARPDKPETFRPGRVQVDGSVDLTRIPTAPKDAPKPPHLLPRGTTETARIKVKVQPRPAAPEPGRPACSCEPVDVDLSLYKGKDGTGVVASSDQGAVDVASSLYIPLTGMERPSLRHFAQITAEPGHDNYTALVGRRLLGGRVGVGIGMARREGGDVAALVGLEVNW